MGYLVGGDLLRVNVQVFLANGLEILNSEGCGPDERHGAHLLSHELESLIQDSSLSDVTLVTETQTFPAHKAILAGE
jgi:BTB/POZ domain